MRSYKLAHHYKSHIESLLAQVQATYGKNVSNSADCSNLAQDILKTTESGISQQTLRRLFKLITSSSDASAYTLEILSKYCGYHSFEQFRLQSDSTALDQGKVREAVIYSHFFDVEMQPISPEGLNNIYRAAIKNIVKRVYHDKDLYNILIRMVAKNPTAHYYLFEQFPYIDGLGRGFAVGYQFYLKFRKDPESQCFGHALLLLSAALKNDTAPMKMHLDAINSIPLSNVRHPFIRARYLGSNLLYAYMKKDSQAQAFWREKALAALTENPNQYGFLHIHMEYERMIGIYLLLCEDFDAVIEVLEPVLNKVTNFPRDMEYGYWLTPIKIMLMRAFSNKKLFKKAKAVLPDYEEVDWVMKDYYEINFLDAKIRMTASKAEKAMLVRDLKRLIAKTNFSFYEKLLTSQESQN